MVYYYQQKNVLKPLDLEQTEAFLYPDVQDLRNYAFLYIYPNNEIEAVIRTGNLTEHYNALMPLTGISPYLRNYKDVLSGDITHYFFDEEVTKFGALQIYYSTSDLCDTDAFGFINAPAILTNFQKQFICDHLAYFEVYQDILLNQFDPTIDSLTELNFMGDGNFLEILRELAGLPKIEQKNGR